LGYCVCDSFSIPAPYLEPCEQSLNADEDNDVMEGIFEDL
jgi:hypothetical protein